MESTNPFWQARSFTVTPSRSTAEIADSGGGALGTWDAQGAVRDTSGTVLLQAPVRSKGHRNKPAEVDMEIKDAAGSALGTARVVKYGLGPRSKKATIAILDPQGTEVARLEPSDDKGERLAVSSAAGEHATLEVEEVKKGFLRKARIYTVNLADGTPEELRPLVLAVAARYDAVLQGVQAAAMEADAKR